jgi:hypothetical protein
MPNRRVLELRNKLKTLEDLNTKKFHAIVAYEALHHLGEALDLVDSVQKQLPEGMEDCNIVFLKCEKGHGRLTAKNWIDHGCPTCVIDMLKACLVKTAMRDTEASGALCCICNGTGYLASPQELKLGDRIQHPGGGPIYTVFQVGKTVRAVNEQHETTRVINMVNWKVLYRTGPA